MSSRNAILGRLRAAQQPFKDVPVPAERHMMVPISDTTPAALLERFVAEANKIGCFVYQPSSVSDAIEQLLNLIAPDKTIMAWEREHIPLPALPAALDAAGVRVMPPTDGRVRVGITGADAALAGTGSLVLVSRPGQYRQVSLLPDIHVAVVRPDRIMAGLEAWFAHQRQGGLDQFRQAANVVIVTGPSKTADIAQELILGAHGPKEVHMLIAP